MELLVVNISGTTRYVNDSNTRYVVAPVSMIVPGVLPGSQGPLFYPSEEVATNVSVWNDIPIVVYHPTDDEGKSVSANSVEVWEKQGIGHLRNARYENGKLRADGWFDIQRTQRVDSRVFASLKYKQPIELSTGLYTTNVPAPEGSNYNGVTYTHTARNYRPDHLAILPDQTGACSISDGCGVLNTQFDQSGSLPNLDSYDRAYEYFHQACDKCSSDNHLNRIHSYLN